jgi:hypothetical protein
MKRKRRETKRQEGKKTRGDRREEFNKALDLTLLH